MPEGPRTNDIEHEIAQRIDARLAGVLRSVADRLASGAEPAILPDPSGPVAERAIEVIGDRDEALRWLGTPVRALDYATPISLLGTPDGQERVMTVLMQLEHGVL